LVLREEDETSGHNGCRLPPRRGCPARQRCLVRVRPARPRRLGEGLDAVLPGPSSPDAASVKGSTSRRPARSRLAPRRPALVASPPSPAAVAPESPPLAPPLLDSHHRPFRPLVLYRVERERRRQSNIYGLDKKTHGREGRGKKKRKEKGKGIKKRKKERK
jgi:hypothetical protein